MEQTKRTSDPNDNSEEEPAKKQKLNSSLRYKTSEKDVGITEFIGKTPGFNIVVKERYSDFLVNEINLDNEVVRLTDMNKPEEPEIHFNFKDLLSEEVFEELKQLSNGEKSSEISIDVTNKEKDSRKDIHIAIRKTFPNLESNTLDKDDKKFIVVKKANKKNKGRRFCPSDGGNYLHFVLYKENKDTMYTINQISSFLRLQPKVFSFAGSKDRKGKTSQLVSAYRLSADKLLSLNERFDMIKVGNIVHKKEQIKLGDLKGNLFVLILRQLSGSKEVVDEAISSLSTKGFINYYGLQRFGTTSVPTHAIGRCILEGKWKNAIDLILQENLNDEVDLTYAKAIWNQTGDAKRAYEQLNRSWSLEGKLLSGLATAHKNDFLNALAAIPRNMRLMYIHSYQSYIWNKIVSRRLQKYGLKVLIGDLIQKAPEVSVESTESEQEDDSKKESLARLVCYVTDENIDKVSIKDVVLPLPGHSVMFPNNEIKEWYDEILKEENMTWSNFNSHIKSYSLCGAYRKFIVVPSDIKWEILPYDDNTIPLVASDLDILNESSIPQPKGGSLRALKLEFKLPPSSYATMVIREISKLSSDHVKR